MKSTENSVQDTSDEQSLLEHGSPKRMGHIFNRAVPLFTQNGIVRFTATIPPPEKRLQDSTKKTGLRQAEYASLKTREFQFGTQGLQAELLVQNDDSLQQRQGHFQGFYGVVPVVDLGVGDHRSQFKQ